MHFPRSIRIMLVAALSAGLAGCSGSGGSSPNFLSQVAGTWTGFYNGNSPDGSEYETGTVIMTVTSNGSFTGHGVGSTSDEGTASSEGTASDVGTASMEGQISSNGTVTGTVSQPQHETEPPYEPPYSMVDGRASLTSNGHLLVTWKQIDEGRHVFTANLDMTKH